MHDSQEAEHSAEPTVAFHAAVAEPKGDEETPGPCRRVDQQTAEREGSEAGDRGTDTRDSRLVELFPDGECRPGVQQDGLFRSAELAPLAISARRATANEASAIHRQSALRDGTAQVDGHSE